MKLYNHTHIPTDELKDARVPSTPIKVRGRVIPQGKSAEFSMDELTDPRVKRLMAIGALKLGKPAIEMARGPRRGRRGTMSETPSVGPAIPLLD